MTTAEIAEAIVSMNRAGSYHEIYSNFYSPSAISIENWGGQREVYDGITAILKKASDWEAGVEEIHSTSVSDPLVADSSFAVTFTMDITYKDPAMGRIKMTELAIYTVEAGKIIAEEFRG